MIHRFILLNKKQICPWYRGHTWWTKKKTMFWKCCSMFRNDILKISLRQNWRRRCIYNRLTSSSDRLWRNSVIIIRRICVCVWCGEKKLYIMCVNQSSLTDRPANIMIKQNAYVAIVTFFCSAFSPAPSSNCSSLVTFVDFQLHSFLRNLEPKSIHDY